MQIHSSWLLVRWTNAPPLAPSLHLLDPALSRFLRKTKKKTCHWPSAPPPPPSSPGQIVVCCDHPLSGDRRPYKAPEILAALMKGLENPLVAGPRD